LIITSIIFQRNINKKVTYRKQIVVTHTQTHTHSILTAIFQGELELASCPLNSPTPFIPGLRILLGQA